MMAITGDALQETLIHAHRNNTDEKKYTCSIHPIVFGTSVWLWL